MIEIWKDVSNYENLYRISNFGNVLSLAKTDGNGNRDRLLKSEKVTTGNKSYRRVTLSKNGITKRFAVHRLVAINFIPNPDSKPQVNHIDNDGTNNSVENLEWCTGKENMLHSALQGRQDIPKRLGSIAASLANHQRAVNKFTESMGARFIETFTKTSAYGTRRFVKYSCKCCAAIYTIAANTKPIRNNGICNPCFEDDDIV